MPKPRRLICLRPLIVVAIAASAVAPVAALAACPAPGKALIVGKVASVASGAALGFSLDLKAGQGVIVDLAALAPAAAKPEGEDAAAPGLRALSICDSAGKLLAPEPGEVFEKGGSVSDTPDGERLRFVPPVAGRYVIGVAAGDAPREIFARNRDLGAGASGVFAVRLGSEQEGTVSSASPQTFSFAGTVGQWVELKSTSESDTVLNLAGPARDGSYAVIAKNDDSDGLNPLIRRRLPANGIYYLQVDSLAADAGAFTLSLKKIAIPPPPAPTAALSAGMSINGVLAIGNEVKLYTLPVTAGNSYRLTLTAPYDAAIAIGLPNPIETEDGDDSGFSEIKSQDSGTSGTEKLDFTARSTGQLLVRVKSFGTMEGEGGFTLAVMNTGG